MTDVDEEVAELRNLYAWLQASRQDHDLDVPTFLSHARDYADQPERLRHYARSVVPGRMLILTVSSLKATQGLLQTYLTGVDVRSPYPLLLAARAQLELYFVVADVIRVVEENKGEHDERFPERVRAVDEALINATYGTRLRSLKEKLPQLELSRLREADEDDLKLFDAKSVLTRLERLARGNEYSKCLDDYEQLCEFVHPNWGLKMLTAIPSPINSRFIRFSMTSDAPFQTGLGASLEPMLKASRGTVATLEVPEPFGSIPLVDPRSLAVVPRPNRATRRAKKR